MQRADEGDGGIIRLCVYSAGYQHAVGEQSPEEALPAIAARAEDAAWFAAHPTASARLRGYAVGEFAPAHDASWQYTLVRLAVAGIRLREPVALAPLAPGHEAIRLTLGAEGDVLRQEGGMPVGTAFAAPRIARRGTSREA